MKKTFLLDTNVLMRSPRSVYVFENNDVYICNTTLEELDNLKNKLGETGYQAREAVRVINEIRQKGSVSEGVKLPNKGIFKVVPDFNNAPYEEVRDMLPYGWSLDKPDNRIIVTAKELNAILITNDISMVIKAEVAGVQTESYRHEQVSEDTLKYTGRSTVYAKTDSINKLYQEGQLSPDKLYDEKGKKLKRNLNVNEFLVIQDTSDPQHSALGRYNGKHIVTLKYVNSEPCDVKPRNVAQKFAIEALMTPASEIPLVILKGPAGTAKTFLTLAAGLEQTMNKHDYKKLLIFRPNIKFDEDIGYLKGDEMDKIKPLLRPCFDNFEVLLGNKKDKPEEIQDKINELFERGYVCAEAMAYLRGRSIPYSYIFCDESQNSTPEQILGVISRAGIDSKIVIVGDPDQIDNSRLDRRNNGLVYACEKMLGSHLCAQLSFGNEECVRSPLAQEASELLKK